MCHDLSSAKLEFDSLAILVGASTGRPSKNVPRTENEVAREFSGCPSFTPSIHVLPSPYVFVQSLPIH